MAGAVPFDVGFQRAILRLCLTDDSFNTRALEWLNPSHFTTKAHGWLFKALQDHHKSYRVRCSDIALREYARTSGDPVYQQEVESVLTMPHVTDEAFVRDQLREFVRRSEFALAHRESMQQYNGGKHDSAYDTMQYAMERIRQIDFDDVDRSWFFESIEDRNIRRYRDSIDPTKDTFTTGWPELDSCLNGGLSLGEILLVLGRPKIGKSTWLINQAFHACRLSRVPTLYVNLEGSTSLIENRLDACFSAEQYGKVRQGDISPVLWRRMLDEYEQLRGLMVVRTFSEWDCNILHIDAELRNLKGQGFVPSVIILDYVDLLRSRYPRDSETQNQVDAMRDAKSLANRGYGIWSACQGRRAKKSDFTKQTILRSDDIADAYGKVRIADGYGSLNASEEEKSEQQMRLFWEDYRDGAVGRLWKLQNDMARMRLGVSIEPMKLGA